MQATAINRDGELHRRSDMLRLSKGFDVGVPFVGCSKWGLRYFEEIWVTRPIMFRPSYELQDEQ
jgi:hypothetical protein